MFSLCHSASKYKPCMQISCEYNHLWALEKKLWKKEKSVSFEVLRKSLCRDCTFNKILKNCGGFQWLKFYVDSRDWVITVEVLVIVVWIVLHISTKTLFFYSIFSHPGYLSPQVIDGPITAYFPQNILCFSTLQSQKCSMDSFLLRLLGG